MAAASVVERAWLGAAFTPMTLEQRGTGGRSSGRQRLDPGQRGGVEPHVRGLERPGCPGSGAWVNSPARAARRDVELRGEVAQGREAIAIDRQVLAAEARMLGVALLARSSRGVTLTPAGTVLVGEAQQAIVREIAVRAVLTQQISVKAGRTHAGRLVAAAGEPLTRPRGSITHLFPTAEAIAAAPDSAFAMPTRRRETLRSLAGADLRDLVALPGIGPWTQAYVNMRALRDRDAWLGTDLVVRHALGDLDPDAWRPFRAYAVVHLWNRA
jgi:AraC family transcriptional regulator of adaptative response / DNA-3-methyladenine glycosylase II